MARPAAAPTEEVTVAPVLAILVALAAPRPIDLGALSLERARALDGRAIAVTFLGA